MVNLEEGTKEHGMTTIEMDTAWRSTKMEVIQITWIFV